MEFKSNPSIPSMNIKIFIDDPEEKNWKGPFQFIQAADPELGMSKFYNKYSGGILIVKNFTSSKLTIRQPVAPIPIRYKYVYELIHTWSIKVGSYKLNQTEPTWEIELTLMREAIEKINCMQPKPRFMVICGDMLDAYPLERPPLFYKSRARFDLETRKLHYKDFVKALQELDSDIKLVCVCGNHDVGDIPSRKTLQVYRNQFGTDYVAFWVKFVVLNSQLFVAPKAIPEETDKQLKFLNSIGYTSAKFIVVFQHIPFFVLDSQEDDAYYNIQKTQRFPLLETLYKLGVKYIFCGHYHQNGGGKFKDMELAVTSALGAPMGDDPSGYRIVYVNDDIITHEYISLRDTTEFVIKESVVNDKCEETGETSILENIAIMSACGQAKKQSKCTVCYTRLLNCEVSFYSNFS